MDSIATALINPTPQPAKSASPEPKKDGDFRSLLPRQNDNGSQTSADTDEPDRGNHGKVPSKAEVSAEGAGRAGAPTEGGNPKLEQGDGQQVLKVVPEADAQTQQPAGSVPDLTTALEGKTTPTKTIDEMQNVPGVATNVDVALVPQQNEGLNAGVAAAKILVPESAATIQPTPVNSTGQKAASVAQTASGPIQEGGDHIASALSKSTAEPSDSEQPVAPKSAQPVLGQNSDRAKPQIPTISSGVVSETTDAKISKPQETNVVAESSQSSGTEASVKSAVQTNVSSQTKLSGGLANAQVQTPAAEAGQKDVLTNDVSPEAGTEEHVLGESRPLAADISKVNELVTRSPEQPSSAKVKAIPVEPQSKQNIATQNAGAQQTVSVSNELQQVLDHADTVEAIAAQAQTETRPEPVLIAQAGAALIPTNRQANPAQSKAQFEAIRSAADSAPIELFELASASVESSHESPETVAKFEDVAAAKSTRFTEALVSQIRSVDVSRGRTQIELIPRGLGRIDIDIVTETDNSLKVIVTAENATVLQSLRGGQDLLTQTLGLSDNSSFEFKERQQQGSAGQSQQPDSGQSGDNGTDVSEPTAAGNRANIIDDGQLDIVA